MALTMFTPLQLPPFPSGSGSLLQGKLVSSFESRVASGVNPKPETQNPKLLSPTGQNQQLKEVSQEFEAVLLSFLFKAMRQTVPKSDFMGKGRDRTWYDGLLDVELARSLAQGGGVGLSTLVLGDLQRLQGREVYGQMDDEGRRAYGRMGEETNRPPANSPIPPAGTSATREAEGMVLPVTGRLSSAYGLRLDPFHRTPKFHHGLDIASPVGTEIRAVRPGTVLFSGWKEGYGLTVILSHEDGYTTQYSHNSRNLVEMGDRVSQEQSIALVGQTGQTTGPHVHFEVRRDGKAVDPTALFVTKA